MGKFEEYRNKITQNSQGQRSPQSLGRIPTYEEAAGQLGWSQPESTDLVSSLLMSIMGADKSSSPAGAASDDLRSWYGSAESYAKTTGQWPEWEILQALGVPTGQPYREPDTSPVIGQSDKYTSQIFGDEGTPITQQMYDQYVGNTDLQTLSTEQRRTQQIAQIMEATNYDADTASYIYDTFMDDAGFEGGSAWEKGSYTPEEMKQYTNQRLKSSPEPLQLDSEALDEFYRTSADYTGAEGFDEALGFTGDLGTTLNRGNNEPINVRTIRGKYFNPAVEIINQSVDKMRQNGDLASIIKFIREAGIDSNSTFNVQESMRAVKWLADNNIPEAKDFFNTIIGDNQVYTPITSPYTLK